jgi:hypothetical protein
MKKLVLTAMALAAGITLSHAQGTITISSTAAVVFTNGATSGAAFGGAAGAYSYEVLAMTSTAFAGLSGQQQAGVYSLLANQSDISLWSDTGITGTSTTLHQGGISSTATTTANGTWAAPTSGAGYSTAPSYDYYSIIGWSSALGNWATVSAELAANSLGGTSGWFGQSGTAYNYAGGGASGLGSVSLFAGSAATGLAGSGGLPSTGAVVLNALPVPEPATLALAGLGGLSMLFLRRRKS